MAHLVQDLLQYLQFDEINIDNWHFKLYYKGAAGLFFMGSMVGVLSQYFGQPIQCDFTTIDGDVAADYCWIHGSSYIPVEYQPHMKCIADLEGVKSEDDAPDTSYYQWVVFFMLLQAGFFYLPYKIWKALEGGLIESFGKDAKSAVILTKETKVDGEGAVMEKMTEKFSMYFKSILHHNQFYLAKFFFCEALNIIILYTNFILTDTFLQGRFWYYGIDVIRFYQLSRAERKLVVSPFCATFPTEVSCTVPNIGAAGGEQHHNGMCVLSQNILNEKIYLVVWWYLVFLCMISVIFIVYRLSVCLFEPIRFQLLYVQIRHKYDDDVRKALRFVLSKCYLGDWFVLYQLSKNVNPYFLRQFVKELRYELKERPKRSKSFNKEKEKEGSQATLRKDASSRALLNADNNQPNQTENNP